MSRNLSAPMIAGLTSNAIAPAFLLVIGFRSTTEYVWSGYGDLVYAGNTYKGVGDLGNIGAITEGTDGTATGTSVTLSGINSTLLAETLTDIQLGAPATLYLALIDASFGVIATPYVLFAGTVDQPSIKPGMEEFSITLKLENKYINLNRANMRRYTAADQKLYYPNDQAFNGVEGLSDQALRWGG